MASSSQNTGSNFKPAEGQALNRPPLFYGTNYTFWKIKMETFLQSLDLDIMSVVTKPFKVPEKLDDTTRPLMALNIKAKTALYACLTDEEFTRITTCKTAYDIWKKLELAHEGSTQIKESKVIRLNQEWSNFRMYEDESIDSLNSRFNTIISALHTLGKIYTEKENCQKLLVCMTDKWDFKVTVITESVNFATLTVDELMSKFRVHEMDFILKKQRELAEPKKKALALKAKKTAQSEPSEYEFSSDDGESSVDDMMLLARRFSKFARAKKNGKYNFTKGKNLSSSNSTKPICYGCGQVGHMKNECNAPAKDKGKSKAKFEKKTTKKAYQAVWDDTDDESENEE